MRNGTVAPEMPDATFCGRYAPDDITVMVADGPACFADRVSEQGAALS